MISRRDKLNAIYREYAHDPAFDSLRAHDPPKRVVAGRGSLHPRLVLIGEAPGETEAIRGRPFSGPAGWILDELLEHVGLNRREVFITNTVKIRPTIGDIHVRNRTPTDAEIVASRPYLEREIDVFESTPVVTLGTTPLRALMPRVKPRVSHWHGRGWYDAYRQYVSLYHPAVAIYDPSSMATLKADMKIVRTLI